eukprot:6210185-Pleurochrysis_carterae.AAC.2
MRCAPDRLQKADIVMDESARICSPMRTQHRYFRVGRKMSGVHAEGSRKMQLQRTRSAVGIYLVRVGKDFEMKNWLCKTTGKVLCSSEP